MVLVSINSADADNGYNFSNDFSEALVIDPKASVSLVNIFFKRRDRWVVNTDNNSFSIKLGSPTAGNTDIDLTDGNYTGDSLANHISTLLNTAGNATGYYFKCYYDNVNHLFKFLSSTQEVSGTTPVNFVGYLFKTSKPALGDLLGFGQTQLYITSGMNSISNELESDSEPIPEDYKGYEDIIQFNINNMPLKSIVGQKVTATATLDDDVAGSKNGVTKMIAQIPRFLSANGNGSPVEFGPFFYNYFDYSIPLKNAHSINMNEIQITATNIDGTLATDIIECRLLINITNEENIGGHGPETIGAPGIEKQTSAQINQKQPQFLPKP
jgi:hypothetical protein